MIWNAPLSNRTNFKCQLWRLDVERGGESVVTEVRSPFNLKSMLVLQLDQLLEWLDGHLIRKLKDELCTICSKMNI